MRLTAFDNCTTCEALKEPRVNMDNPEPKRRRTMSDYEYEVKRNYGAQGSCCERDRD